MLHLSPHVRASPLMLCGPVPPPSASRVTIPEKRSTDSDGESDGETDPDVRRKLLDEFAKRFGYNLPVMLQGSDWLINKLARHHRRKFLKFVSLTDIQCAADTKTPEQELSVSKDRLVVRDQKKKYKSNVSALAFLNSIELLMFAYVTVSMNDPTGDEWASLSVTLGCFEFAKTHLSFAHEYLAAIRALLTYDASLQGTGRFAVSAADLACREEWARLSTFDSSLTGPQIISTLLLSHASAFPTRAALLELNKKVAPPVAAASKFPARSSSDRTDGGERKRDRTDGWS